jgi:DNA polymerase III delta subunit
MMLRRSILIEPELSEPKAYTKEKKFSFSGEQKEKPFWVLIFLLPRSVQNLDLSNLVRVFELLLKWDRDAGRSL